jgi:hypothetical protein
MNSPGSVWKKWGAIMTSIRSTLAAGAVAVVAMTGAASATGLSIIGGAAGFIPGGAVVNDALAPLGLGNPLGGFYGAQIDLKGPAKVTFTLLGWEAGFENAFNGPGGSFSTEGNAGHPSNLEFDAGGIADFMANLGAGLIPFSFLSPLGVAANGANPLNVPGAVNFFASFGDDTTTMGNSLYLFLDDLGGGDDDNHDDLVVRVDVTPVPLPAGIWLFGAALGGLGLLGRKRRANA